MKRALARQLRSNATDAERILWRRLRMRQLARYKFRRQHALGRYVVDFVCLSHRLVIEVDGGQHADRTEYDAARTIWLQSQGYRVLRFWNPEVVRHLEAVCEVIWRALRARDVLDPPS